MISSVDGRTWNVEPPLNSFRLTSLETNNQSIIVGGWDGGPSSENLFISTGGQNWTNLDILSNSQILDIEFIENSKEYIASTYEGKFLRSTAVYSTTSALENLNLQVGSNGGDTFTLELADARTKALGIDDMDFSTRQGALSVLSKIDKAMEKVSSERGKYGAYQNALEHVHNNVSNYEMNLTASESRIRDADMAKQTMEMTKNQILSQSSQAMLSLANQQPQQVLQLLK
jgi:flagellin